MNKNFYSTIAANLQELRAKSLYKEERAIRSAQGRKIEIDRSVINMCANNYLGLASHPELVKEAKTALDRYGYGLSSVRFICGTLDIHHKLEQRLATFLGTEDAILYSSCFDANTGLFETFLAAQDAIISDELNHASIIDGIRLCKAERHRYRNNDMADLEAKLLATQGCRWRMIATDGVFSMDGTIAKLTEVCALAKKHNALVLVDDSHGVGVLGEKRGAGSIEQVAWGGIDFITGTLGKALGGASGGYVAGRKTAIAMLRQKSRPYLFSNSLAPAIVATSLRVLQMVEETPRLREELARKTAVLREELSALGFEVLGGGHPIVPILVYTAETAQKMARGLYAEGVYAVGFFYPVVPKGKARIRLQVSAAHTDTDLETVIGVLAKVGRQLGVIK